MARIYKAPNTKKKAERTIGVPISPELQEQVDKLCTLRQAMLDKHPSLTARDIDMIPLACKYGLHTMFDEQQNEWLVRMLEKIE